MAKTNTKGRTVMNCPICNKSLIWENDFSYEDYGHEGNGIVGLYTCDNVECIAEDINVFMPINNDEI